MPRRTKRNYKRRPQRKKAHKNYLTQSMPWKVAYTPRTNQTLTLLRPMDESLRFVLAYSPMNDTFLSITHSLRQTYNYQEFQRMFDMYRIDCVYVDITPRTTSVNQVDIGTIQLNGVKIPNYTIAVDRDDSVISPVAGFNSIKVRHGSKTQNCITRRRFTYTPSRLTGAQDVSGDNKLSIIDKNVNEFINTRNDDIIHYGLKLALDGSQGGPVLDNLYSMDIRLTYKITFKNLNF